VSRLPTRYLSPAAPLAPLHPGYILPGGIISFAFSPPIYFLFISTCVCARQIFTYDWVAWQSQCRVKKGNGNPRNNLVRDCGCFTDFLTHFVCAFLPFFPGFPYPLRRVWDENLNWFALFDCHCCCPQHCFISALHKHWALPSRQVEALKTSICVLYTHYLTFLVHI